MFLLEDNICDLDIINKIIITFFKKNTADIVNVFDNNFVFNEDIIPVITSLFECIPKIYNNKRYTCIDSICVISSSSHIDTNRQVSTSYPCFYTDIKNSHLEVKNIKQDLIKTLVDDTSNQLIRFYNISQISSTNFEQCILYEIEYKTISWIFDWGSVNININLLNSMCNYEVQIDVIESKKLITSRVQHINDILNKFNKIISEFIIK